MLQTWKTMLPDCGSTDLRVRVVVRENIGIHMLEILHSEKKFSYKFEVLG